MQRLAAILIVALALAPAAAPGAAGGGRVIRIYVYVQGRPLAGVDLAATQYGLLNSYPDPGLIVAENTTGRGGEAVLYIGGADPDKLYVFIKHPVYGTLDLDPGSPIRAGAKLSDLPIYNGHYILDLGDIGGYMLYNYTILLNITDEYGEPVPATIRLFYDETLIASHENITGRGRVGVAENLLMGPGIDNESYIVEVQVGRLRETIEGLAPRYPPLPRIYDMHPPVILGHGASITYVNTSKHVELAAWITYRDGANTGYVDVYASARCIGCRGGERVIKLTPVSTQPLGNGYVNTSLRANKLLLDLFPRDRNISAVFIFETTLRDAGNHVIDVEDQEVFNYTYTAPRNPPEKQGEADRAGGEGVEKQGETRSRGAVNASQDTGTLDLPGNSVSRGGSAAQFSASIYWAGPFIAALVLVMEHHRRRIRGS